MLHILLDFSEEPETKPTEETEITLQEEKEPEANPPDDSMRLEG